MTELNIAKNQGLSQAIATKLGLSKDQLKGIKQETWQSVMTQINTVQDERNKTPEDDNIFTGGNDVKTINQRSTWHSNFVVKEGTVNIDDDAWANIEHLLTGKPLPEPVKEEEVKKEEPVKEEPVKKEEPPKAEEPVKQAVPEDAKIQKRNIVTTGEKGSKEVVAKQKVDGVKVYHEVVTDEQTGTQVFGNRLIADPHGILKKNEYYAVDDSIPNGAKADEKTVNGQKNAVIVTIKDENGKKQRFSTKLTDDGKLTLGSPLVPIAGSSKYYTQSKIDEEVKQMLGGKSLPKGVTVQLMESYGDVCYIFKKNGQQLDPKQIKALIAEEEASKKAEKK